MFIFYNRFQVKNSELFLQNSLPVHKYIFEDGSLDNGINNPENKCFCRKNKCLKPGLIDVTDCYYGKIVKYHTIPTIGLEIKMKNFYFNFNFTY